MTWFQLGKRIIFVKRAIFAILAKLCMSHGDWIRILTENHENDRFYHFLRPIIWKLRPAMPSIQPSSKQASQTHQPDPPARPASQTSQPDQPARPASQPGQHSQPDPSARPASQNPDPVHGHPPGSAPYPIPTTPGTTHRTPGPRTGHRRHTTEGQEHASRPSPKLFVSRIAFSTFRDSRISRFWRFSWILTILTILTKMDYSCHFDHFCEIPASFTVRKCTSGGSSQNSQNVTFWPKCHFLTQNAKNVTFWPKCHFLPKMAVLAKTDYSCHFDHFCRKWLSFTVKKCRFAARAQNRQKVWKSRKNRLFHLFDFLATEDSQKTTTEDSQPKTTTESSKSLSRHGAPDLSGPRVARNLASGQGVRGTPRNGKNHATVAKTTLKPHMWLKVVKTAKTGAKSRLFLPNFDKFI